MESVSGERIEAVRRFSRFYTRMIGVLEEHLLRSPFSLTEGRVLYELAHAPEVTASDLARGLNLDPGYLSRILRGFEERGLIERRASDIDGRQQLVSLTERGVEAFQSLDSRSRQEIGTMLGELSDIQQRQLVTALGTVERLLGDQPLASHTPYLLRSHRPGDMGWVVSRHGELYAQEYGWDETFEALVAEIVAAFIQHYKPRRERCWIAEREGENIGSVFLVEQSLEVAKLRLLLVEPSARGLGVGRRLVGECIRFARQAGYTTLTLWTNDILHAARCIYQQAGFKLVAEEQHQSFGHDLIAQTWELKL